MYNEFDVSIVLAYEAKPKSEAELRHLLPTFRPLRGAKSPEKIAEQQNEHWANWELGAASRVHCAEIERAVLIVHRMFDRKLFHVQTEAELYEALRHAGNMTPGRTSRVNCRWMGENTQLAVKTWQFQLARAGYFSGVVLLPNWLVYGAKHFDLSSLLEAGGIDTDVAVESLLSPDQITKLRAIEDPLTRQAATTEACFVQVGELRLDSSLPPATTVKVKAKAK